MDAEIPRRMMAADTMLPPYLRLQGDGLYLRVHVQPGAKADEITGCHGDALKIRLRARAMEGAANTALSAFLCATLHLRHSQITLVQGESARTKVLWIRAASTRTRSQLAEYATPSYPNPVHRKIR